MFTKKLPGKSSLEISESLQVMRCLEKKEDFVNLQKFTKKPSQNTKPNKNTLKHQKESDETSWEIEFGTCEKYFNKI